MQECGSRNSYSVSTLLCRTEVINAQSVHPPFTILTLRFSLYYHPFASLSTFYRYLSTVLKEINILLI